MKPYVPAVSILAFIVVAIAGFGYVKIKNESSVVDIGLASTTTSVTPIVVSESAPTITKDVVKTPVVPISKPISTPTPVPPPVVVVTPEPTPTGYTLAQVSAHGNKSSCWTAIEGQVYDITNYINQHPGGSAILRSCGVDGTRMFNGVGAHRGSIGGLASYIIGPLI